MEEVRFDRMVPTTVLARRRKHYARADVKKR